MRRVAVLIALIAVLAAGCTASAATTAANRALARQTATTLLSEVGLPAGAVAVARPPAGTAQVLNRPASHSATPALVDRHALWIVPAELAAVDAYVSKHLPVRVVGQGTVGGPGVPPTMTLAAAAARPRPGLQFAGLAITMSSLGTRTAVRVDGQAVWTVVRTAGERVPAGVTEIRIRRGPFGNRPAVSQTVTARAKTARIVAFLDALPVVQPGATSCPSDFPVPDVTFMLLGSDHRVLARASEPADATASGERCARLAFVVGKRREPALRHADTFLQAVDRLAGVIFDVEPPVSV